MKDIRTHYENLKVARDAPPEVIKAAYRALAQKCHPDRNPGDREAAETTASLNHSYEVLMDPTARRDHDQWIDAMECTRGELPATADGGGRTPMQGPDGDSLWGVNFPSALLRFAKTGPFRIGAVFTLATVLAVAGALKVRDRQALPESLWTARMVKEAGFSSEATAVSTAEPARTEGGARDGAVPAERELDLAVVQDVETEAPVIDPVPTPVLVPSRIEQRCADNASRHTLPRESYSGYLPDRPIGNADGWADLIVDNTATDHDALVKLVDVEQATTVRLFQVKANATFTLQNLSQARYKLLYRYKVEECTPYVVGEILDISGEKTKAPGATLRTRLRPG